MSFSIAFEVGDAVVVAAKVTLNPAPVCEGPCVAVGQRRQQHDRRRSGAAESAMPELLHDGIGIRATLGTPAGAAKARAASVLIG